MFIDQQADSFFFVVVANKLNMSQMTAWKIFGNMVINIGPVLGTMAAYNYYFTKNQRIRMDMFYNKSKLYGGQKNPQY
jgi:hypothetical protein